MLQGCPSTHWLRCRRHDFAVNTIAKHLIKKGLRVEKEPNIWTAADGQRPDIVVLKKDEIIVSDVQIVWEGPRPLASAYQAKVDYYTTPPFIEGVRRK